MTAPHKVVVKANHLLQQLEAGAIQPRKMREKGFYSVKVGWSYRLLSTDNRQTWQLISHEKYNKICSPGSRHGR